MFIRLIKLRFETTWGTSLFPVWDIRFKRKSFYILFQFCLNIISPIRYDIVRDKNGYSGRTTSITWPLMIWPPVSLERKEHGIDYLRYSGPCLPCPKLSTTYTIAVLSIINYPLFANAHVGNYPHAPSQYHARSKALRYYDAECGFPYPRTQTRGKVCIPCANDVCHFLKRFRSFKIPAIPLTQPKSSYKYGVTRSHRSGKENGWRSESSLC